MAAHPQRRVCDHSRVGAGARKDGTWRSSGQINNFSKDIPDHATSQSQLQSQAATTHRERSSASSRRCLPSSPAGALFSASSMHLPPLALTMAASLESTFKPFPCPSASSPNRSSTASPPAKWSNVPRAYSQGTGRKRHRCRGQRVDIFTDGGGRRRIGITDDGSGMTMATLHRRRPPRHLQARRRGFRASARSGSRGEALPSIGAVARLGITTRHAGEPHAWSLSVEGGRNPTSCRRRCRTAPVSR